MATEYVRLPGPLVDKAREAAAGEEIAVEELVRDAVEQHLSRIEWAKILEFGERHARERRLEPEDVMAEIAAHRSDLVR